MVTDLRASAKMVRRPASRIPQFSKGDKYCKELRKIGMEPVYKGPVTGFYDELAFPMYILMRGGREVSHYKKENVSGRVFDFNNTRVAYTCEAPIGSVPGTKIATVMVKGTRTERRSIEELFCTERRKQCQEAKNLEKAFSLN